MKPLLGLLFVLVAALPAQARLGETPEQLEARFGKPLDRPPHITRVNGPDQGVVTQDFEKQGVTISVMLLDVSIGETYTGKREFTPEQIQALLDANSQGHKWTASSTFENRPNAWQRDDGSVAVLSSPPISLIIRSKTLIDREAAWEKAQHPDVKGF